MTLNMNGREIKLLLDIIEKRNVYAWKDGINKITKKLERALKPIKVSSRKGKGRGLQQQICKDIAEVLEIEYDQDDDSCEIHSREMGQAGKDIILRGRAYERFPYSIECKCVENLHLDKAIKQAKHNMDKRDLEWMVVHKKKNQSILVTLEWEELKSLLYREYNE